MFRIFKLLVPSTIWNSHLVTYFLVLSAGVRRKAHWNDNKCSKKQTSRCYKGSCSADLQVRHLPLYALTVYVHQYLYNIRLSFRRKRKSSFATLPKCRNNSPTKIWEWMACNISKRKSENGLWVHVISLQWFWTWNNYIFVYLYSNFMYYFTRTWYLENFFSWVKT